jgi:hypothetical protein
VNLIRGRDLIAASLRGAKIPTHIQNAVAGFLSECSEARAGKGLLCADCDTEFSSMVLPADFIMIAPRTGRSGSKIILTGICERCSKHDDEYLFRVGMNDAKKMWTDAYELPSGGGVQ